MALPKREIWTQDTRGGLSERGGGRGGGGRGGRGNRASQPCRNMQENGRCRFGDSCAFSHDLSLDSTPDELSKRTRQRPEETPQQQRAKEDYRSWRRLIKNPPKTNDNRTIELLWNDALNILNGEDRNWKQMLPRDLDDEEYCGRQHIQTLMSMVAGHHGHSTFVDLAHPFLLVITHPAVLDCLSVDTSVGGLYNYISGSNGSRAIPFFQRLSTSLLEKHLELAPQSLTASLETTLTAMSAALRELLKREPRAIFHENLPDLLDSIENIAEATNIDPYSVAFQVVRNSIGELRGVVARAHGLLQYEEEPPEGCVSTSVVASTYPRDLILPLDRHDNDKMDITKIKILPTEDEIRSEHADFLPSTDPDQPHFLADQLERYLDTHFRLYRHDCFGEVSEALGAAMIAIENDPGVLEDSRFSLGNIRAYTLPKAHIRYISFDRRRGLEAQISFPYPFSLRKKSSSERRKWWEDSKRLEEGTLLCLLFVDNTKASLLFFTVSEKRVDTNRDPSLSSDNHQATIIVKLATRLEHDLEVLIRLSCEKRCGLLVEFPGVLLATFVPILENIQNMQQLSRLPFRQWILPERGPTHVQASTTLSIPSPLYARSSNFHYSLDAILKDLGDAFDMTSGVSFDNGAVLDNLEARTRLDRGQCQALIAALTREFALIQGPPGTGKSYLGVQIMRVLQACKLKAQLGPVVVV